MKKHSKVTIKLNTALFSVLEKLNQQLTENVNGFVSLSHKVEFDNFPASLIVTCLFENKAQLDEVKALENDYLIQLKKGLLKKGIVLKTMHNLQFSC